MDDSFTCITMVGLPYISEVRLYKSVIMKIVDEHPEFRWQLPCQQDALVKAIANPSKLHESTTAPGKSLVLISEAFTYFDNPVYVPVRIVSGTQSGRVQTAYFSDGAYSGRLLWSAQNG